MSIHTRFLIAPLAALALLLLPGALRAQQSDVSAFMLQGVAPNIILVLDTSGSMNNPPSGCSSCPDKFVSAKQALSDLVRNVNPPDGSGGYQENARFGLFTFGGSSSQPRGQLRVAPANGSTAAVLSSISSVGNSSVGTPLGPVLTDVGRYVFGAGNSWGTMRPWGSLSGESSDPSPVDLSCRQTFVVFISDGLATNDRINKYSSADFCATIGDADGDGAEGGCTNGTDWLDDVALVMANTDFSALPDVQGVQVHVIGFDINDPLLSDAAAYGGGTYQTAGDEAALAAALTSAIGSIFGGLVSFTAATVPSTRTSFANGFFSSYFLADTSIPFWEGHLEAYRFSAAGEIIDAAGNPAVDPVTGDFIEPRNPFWDVQARLLDPNHPTRSLYTTKLNARAPFTRAGITATDLALTSADLPNYPTVFGTTDQLRDALVDYVYGLDGFDEDSDTDFTEKRAAILGDIFHSNAKVIGPPPVALSIEEGYGPATTLGTFLNRYQTRKRRLYVGANDGMLHAIDAGQYQAGDDPATAEVESSYYDFGTGNEVFGWVPGMLLDGIKQMPINAPKTQYYVDGSPQAADAWFPSGANDTSKEGIEWTTVLVTGMRQGGPGYLALDVTDPNATSGTHGPYPKFLWEMTDAVEPLGQTWSQPIITRIKMRGSPSMGDECGIADGDGSCRERWVAIFGAGYEEDGDPNYPTYIDPSNAAWRTAAKAIFIVALDDGSVLGKLAYDAADPVLSQMVYAFPSSPAVLDWNFDGLADLIYIGDLGGQLWKWDISAVAEDTDADPYVDTWQAGLFFTTPSANLGSGQFHYRSFFFPPAAALVDGELVLSFGTGERTDLRYAGASGVDDNNRFFVIKDPVPLAGPLGSSIPATPYSEADLTDITNTATDPDLTDLGFFVVADDGEKFISNHVIFAGFLITTSFTPDQNAALNPCEAMAGTSFLYVFDLASGGGFFDPSLGPTKQGRRLTLGGGVAGDPQISLSSDGSTKIVVQRSGGEVNTLDGPDSGGGGDFMIYWKEDL